MRGSRFNRNRSELVAGEVERGKRGEVHVSAGIKVSWLLLRQSGKRAEEAQFNRNRSELVAGEVEPGKRGEVHKFNRNRSELVAGEVERGKRGEVHVSTGTEVSWLWER